MLLSIFRTSLLLSFIFSNVTLLSASNYDEDILEIYSKMLPRFIIMSSQKNKIEKNIEICILYDKLDERVAFSLGEKIIDNYPKGLLTHPIHIIKDTYSNIESCEKTQIIFMFDTNKEQILKTVLFSQERSILTMSYYVSSLTQGADTSLFIGRRVAPYLNIESIKKKKIIFDNLLLRVSKIYIGEGK